MRFNSYWLRGKASTHSHHLCKGIMFFKGSENGHHSLIYFFIHLSLSVLSLIKYKLLYQIFIYFSTLNKEALYVLFSLLLSFTMQFYEHWHDSLSIQS